MKAKKRIMLIGDLTVGMSILTVELFLEWLNYFFNKERRDAAFWKYFADKDSYKFWKKTN